MKTRRREKSGSGDWKSERVASCGGQCCREGTREMHAGWPVRWGYMIRVGQAGRQLRYRGLGCRLTRKGGV
jgi:hypothetical protein